MVEEKKKLEDRYFYGELRKEQRDLVMKELLKEKTEVERRVLEEEKKKEEAKEKLITTIAKKRLRRWLVILLIIILLILLVSYLKFKEII
ncbi:MAG: hypothetical protein QXG91_01320 [Candidatus Aenigmatarchaeota archaeon]